MVHIHLWAVLATFLLLAFAIAQTPPGFTPSCSGNLGVTFQDGMAIRAGSMFQGSGAFAVRPNLSAQHLHIHKKYLVFMIDPDVIDDGKATTFLHWYQADFFLKSPPYGGELFNHSDNGAAYVGPAPPPGPSHRYILLLFVQPSDYVFPECFKDMLPLTLSARQGFDIEQFVRVAGLGEPVAANYFFVGNEGPVTATRVATATSLSEAACEAAVTSYG